MLMESDTAPYIMVLASHWNRQDGEGLLQDGSGGMLVLMHVIIRMEQTIKRWRDGRYSGPVSSLETLFFFYRNVSGIDKNLSISPPAVELLFFIRKLKIEHKSRSVFLLLMQHTFVLVSYWHWQHHLWFYSLLQWKENRQFSFASQPRGDGTAASVSHYTWTGCGKMIQSIF